MSSSISSESESFFALCVSLSGVKSEGQPPSRCAAAVVGGGCERLNGAQDPYRVWRHARAIGPRVVVCSPAPTSPHAHAQSIPCLRHLVIAPASACVDPLWSDRNRASLHKSADWTTAARLIPRRKHCGRPACTHGSLALCTGRSTSGVYGHGSHASASTGYPFLLFERI